jgi:hypothetical protein
LLVSHIGGRLLEFSAALLFHNANCGSVFKGVSGDYTVAVGDDDCACLSEAPIGILLPSLTRNFVEIIGPNLDVIGFSSHDAHLTPVSSQQRRMVAP